MLGRQQIRGAPAAISELFKNAHDAYADEVRADFLRYRGLLAVRDNGLGMSTADFRDRWLTLGTESRLGEVAIPDGRSARPIMGEKGIGRLAIAVLGPQTLVATRAEGEDVVTLSLINWDVFEEPGLNLEEIRFPLLVVSPAFGNSELVDLRDAAAESVTTLRLEPVRRARIAAEIAAFPIDSVELALRLPGPDLRRSGGTAFFVSPVIAELAEDIDREGETPDLVADLIGFANPMDPTPAIKASFWDWSGPGLKRDLIGSGDFWAESDFQDADHEIRGVFDENGFFRGGIRVYTETHDHTITPPKTLGGRVDCGPFAIRLGYVQGKSTETKADPQRWTELSRKLDRIAGLYVYRDAIRILPYGRSTFDWLDIEVNRSKGAAYYFFSYRRMFGYVAITRQANSGLQEKAGREGFRENRAYRQFRDILKHFFVQLAADFFREGSIGAEPFNKRRDELEREAKARAAREKRDAKERRAFARDVRAALRKLRSGQAARAVGKAVKTGLRMLDSATTEGAAAIAFQVGVDAVALARAGCSLGRPAIGLSEAALIDWESYLDAFGELEGEVASATDALRDSAAEALARIRAEQTQPTEGPGPETDIDAIAVRNATDDGITRIRATGGAAGAAVQRAGRRIGSLTDRLVAATEELGAASEGELSERLASIRSTVELNARLLESLKDAADQLDLYSADGTFLSPADLSSAADQELVSLREQAERDLELAQIGLAVEIVSHEFEETTAGIRGHLRALGPWAQTNPDIQAIHSGLVTGFEHLDTYLGLFTPLERRLQSQPVEMSGAQIETFLSGLFGERLASLGISLTATAAFQRHLFTGRPAVFYPVFVNLVDNATFWLRQRNPPRAIELDSQGSALIVRDTGPGIPAGDRAFVFEPGFTRKPGGRGLGLYISREVLLRNGWTVHVVGADGGGAEFRIAPQDEPIRD
jgi:signal transduction histidine kinase